MAGSSGASNKLPFGFPNLYTKYNPGGNFGVRPPTGHFRPALSAIPDPAIEARIEKIETILGIKENGPTVNVQAIQHALLETRDRLSKMTKMYVHVYITCPACS